MNTIVNAFVGLLVILAVDAPKEVKPGFVGVALVYDGDDARSFSKKEKLAGALVESILPGSAAEKAQLLPGDLIVAIGQTPITDASMLIKTVAGMAPGTPAVFKVLRKGEEKKVNVTIGEHPKFNPTLIQKDPPRVGGGRIEGSGTITGGCSNGGDFVVDGRTRINGFFDMKWSGLLDIRIDGQGGPFLEVTDRVTLAGILYVGLNNVTPKRNDRFEIIGNSKSLQGRFGKLMLPELKDGLRFEVVYDDLAKGIDADGDGKHDVTLVVVAGEAQ